MNLLQFYGPEKAHISVEDLATADVVLTSYATLAADCFQRTRIYLKSALARPHGRSPLHTLAAFFHFNSRTHIHTDRHVHSVNQPSRPQ